jgi:MFS family permease
MSQNPSNNTIDNRKNARSRFSTSDKYNLRPLWIGLFIDILGFYIIIPYLSKLIEVFNTNEVMIGLLLATNALFSLFSAPMWGKLSDKYGRRPVLLIAEAGTFTAFLMVAFSNSLALLFIARMVDGIFGGNYPITKAIITDSVPPKERGVQMTNIGVAHTLAGLVAPALGGFLAVILVVPEFPLFLSGLVASGFSFMKIIITIFFVKESWPKSLRQKAEKEIKIKVKIRKNKDATFLLTQYFFHTLSFMTYVGTLAIFIGFLIGSEPAGISILLLISGISRAVVRFTIFKPTMRLLGERNTTIFGLVILTISFFLAGICGYFFPSELWIFILIMVLASYGVSCARGLMMSKITRTVTHKERGKINGMTSTMDSIGQIIGPILGTFLIQELPLYWYGIVMGLLAFVAFIMVFKKITPIQSEGFSITSSESH